MEYTFETGIIVGRFEHIHIGHQKIIGIGLKLCERVLVFIGSVNQRKSERNPYSYEYRKSLFEIIYKEEIESGRMIIKPLSDLEDSSLLSPAWGKYVLSTAKDILGKYPDCIIYGKDKDIFKCFAKEDVKNITEVLVDRKSLGISATMMRQYLKEDNKEEWEKYADPKIWYKYDELKRLL